MSLVSLTPVDLAIAAALLLALAGVTWWKRLGVGGSLAVAALRTALQLTLIGFVLEALFRVSELPWIALVALVMLLVAGREVMARQRRRLAGLWGFGIGALAMFAGAFGVTLMALTVLVRPEPWYHPQYAIPLLGMLLGNTMNGIALSLDRLTETAVRERAVIEQRLMLGARWHEALADIRRDSMRSGLIPIINAMAAAGLVSLPGMMTGQILAGAPPIEAIKYQILIMYLIGLGSGLGTFLAVSLGARRLFDERERLRLDRLRAPRG